MKIRVFRTLFITLLLTLALQMVFSIQVPENSKFVLYFSSLDDLLNSLDVQVDYNIGPVTIFGDTSISLLKILQLYLISESENEEEMMVNLISALPVVVDIQKAKINDILEILNNLIGEETSIIVSKLSQITKKVILGPITFYLIEGPNDVYITANELQRRIVEDMINSKTPTIKIDIPQDAYIYYKGFGENSIWSFLTVDLYGKTVSDEMKVKVTDNEMSVEILIEKELTEYEKSLMKEFETYLSGLNIVENSVAVIGTTKDYKLFLDMFLKEVVGENISQYLTDAVFSVNMNQEMILSGTYDPKFERDIINQFSDKPFFVEVDKNNSVINVKTKNTNGVSIDNANEIKNSLLYAYINLSVMETGLDSIIKLNVQRLENGNLKISANIENYQNLLKSLLEEVASNELENLEYIEEWNEEEYTEEEITTTEETMTEEATTEEATTVEEEEEYYAESFEEEFDPYEISGMINELISITFDKMYEGVLPTLRAFQNVFPREFLDRIEIFPAFGKDGTIYFVFVYYTDYIEQAKTIRDVLYYDYGINSNIVYDKLVITFYEQAGE
ncbi:hypothetical protein IM41_03625 [Fervidobacterium sp. SC_NGM5_G05]|nr:hypothetical protein IM41_03625 [Fervidobacterium sp. SC_NGM5_G05]